jgi:hypothetical protein
MPNSTKKKPISKAAAAALKALESMVIPTADLDVHIKETERLLKPAGFSLKYGVIAYVGRTYRGSRHAQVNVDSGQFSSTWPEWAFGVAEGALRFNKRVVVVYKNDRPIGRNLLNVLCLNIPAPPPV